MGQTLSKLNLIALTASGDAAEKLREALLGFREDIASAIAGGTVYHKTLLDNSTEKNANASSLATSLTLVNSLRALVITHCASTGYAGVHAAASAIEISAPVATDLAEALTLANEIKADYNTHLDESGVHLVDDSTNTIVAADATDQTELNTLLNEIKTDYNAHVIVTMASMLIEA